MVETERLTLTPVTRNDLDIYTQLLTCAQTTRYLPGGKPFSAEYIDNYVSAKVEHWSQGFGTFVVSLKSNPAIKIGYAGVEQIPGTDYCDIRYGLLPAYHGGGYAFEAAKAALRYTFDTGLVSTIYGVAVAENLPSLKLLKKLGLIECDVRLYEAEGLITFFTNSHISR